MGETLPEIFADLRTTTIYVPQSPPSAGVGMIDFIIAEALPSSAA
jgi:hypothetical protein